MLRRGLLSSVGDEQEWRVPDWHRLRLMAVRCRNKSELGFNGEMGQIQGGKRGITSASARGAWFLESLVFCAPRFLLTDKAERLWEAARGGRQVWAAGICSMF